MHVGSSSSGQKNDDDDQSGLCGGTDQYICDSDANSWKRTPTLTKTKPWVKKARSLVLRELPEKSSVRWRVDWSPLELVSLEESVDDKQTNKESELHSSGHFKVTIETDSTSGP